MTTTGLDGALSICRALERLGARHVFGLPGTQNVALFEALRRSSLRTVVPTHELAAAFMAGAAFRVDGRPGVLATIPGPGLTFALTGLAEARLDSAALVHIVNGRPPASRPGIGAQALDQHALLAPVTKGIVSVSRIEAIEEAVETAWRLALAGEPGPVALELSVDPDAPPLRVIGALPEGRAASQPEIEAAWARIASAERPVIVAGQGALACAPAVAELAARLGAPVLTTPSARGIVPETSPLAMGFDVLRGGVDGANALMAAADAVLVLGAKLAHNGSAGGRFVIDTGKLVRVDSSAEVLGATYPASCALRMDVGAFLARPEARQVARGRWSADALANAREAMRPGADALEPMIAGVDAAVFFAALRAALPPDARLVTDTGLHQVMARRHLDIAAPGGLLMPSDLQSMGFGLPAAIAARLTDPSRPVVALVGDGGLRMSGGDIATAARERVALTVLVIDDGCLGQIRMQQLAEHGAASGTELGTFDVAAFADAMGAAHIRVDQPDQLADVLAGCLAGNARTSVNLVTVPAGDTPAIRVRATRARAKAMARRSLGAGMAARLKRLLRGR
jgi:acetolactate synthase-1/2/3 large subunit